MAMSEYTKHMSVTKVMKIVLMPATVFGDECATCLVVNSFL